jgi:hypothetical protein
MRSGLFFTAVLLLLVLAGCKSAGHWEPGDETRWQPQSLYLNRSPHASLSVEVGAVAGAEPSDAVIERLRQFLGVWCDKPGGVTIVRDHPIPREEAAGLTHEALAFRYLQGPTVSNAAFLYILYYDTRISPGLTGARLTPVQKHFALHDDFRWTSPIQPHVHLLPFPATIYIDRQYLAPWPRSFEPLILMHEAGHILGLSQDPRHSANNHCTNRSCIMWPSLRLELPRAIYRSQKFSQTNLCEQCKADLNKSRTSPPSTNLAFVGPVLIRSETNYSVATLPGQVALFTGPLTNFNLTRFFQRMRHEPELPPARLREDFHQRLWVDVEGPSETWPNQLAALATANTDPLESVRSLSSKAVPAVQCGVANKYLRGEKVARNEAEAVKWFRQAAEAGSAEAQNQLGDCYADGIGVSKDEHLALTWYQKAAEQEYPQAMHNLGRCYEYGLGVERDPKTARIWYHRATLQRITQE